MGSPVGIYIEPKDHAGLGVGGHEISPRDMIGHVSTLLDREGEISTESPNYLEFVCDGVMRRQEPIFIVMDDMEHPNIPWINDNLIRQSLPLVVSRQAFGFVWEPEWLDNSTPYVGIRCVGWPDDATWNDQSDIHIEREWSSTLRDPLKSAFGRLRELAPSAKTELEALLELPFNWDLEGGQPVTNHAAVSSAQLLFEMFSTCHEGPSLTSLTIAKDGGVEVTFDGNDGRELFLVVPPRGSEIRFVISFPTESGSYDDLAGFVGRDRTLACLVDDLVKPN